MPEPTHAGRVHLALVNDHPQPLTADALAERLDIDRDTVDEALAELEVDGIVTPSSGDPDAQWMLHGPARQAAFDAANREGSEDA